MIRGFNRNEKSFALLAITYADDARAMVEAAGASITVVQEAGLAAALLSPNSSFWRTRKRVAEELVSFQTYLEMLHAVGPVLPSAPGAALSTASEAIQFLIANAATLKDGLEKFGGMEQHQIVLELPGPTLLSRLVDCEAMADARALMAKGERLAAGKTVQKCAEAERTRLRSDWSERIRTITKDLVDLPQPSADAVLNIVTLSNRGSGAQIEAELEAIDSDWDGALKIKLIGPSPASSFASVMFDRPTIARVRAAATRLGVGYDASVSDVKAAYRNTMKRLHPDVAGSGAEAAARETTIAQAELIRIAAARDALRAAGAATVETPLLARLYREGDRRPAARSDAA